MSSSTLFMLDMLHVCKKRFSNNFLDLFGLTY